MNDGSGLSLFHTGISESEQFLKGTSQIKILSAEDIEGMRVVCKVTTSFMLLPQCCHGLCSSHRHECYSQLAREVLDIAAMMVKPGITTEEIDHAVHLVKIH